jgi:putative flippase GtrA
MASLLQRKGVRQLVKFCIVGASSMTIDLSTQALLLTLFPAWPWWFSKTISFCLAVTNGFIWNSRWTFDERAATRGQYSKFFLTNIIGWLLNLSISKIFLMLFTGQVIHNQNPSTLHVLAASMCAVPFVVIWNFSASKYWTFRAPKADGAEPASGSTSTPPPAPDESTLLA